VWELRVGWTVTPFVTIPDGAQVEVISNLDGPNVENRLWFVSRQPPVTPTQLQALSDGVASWYVAQVLPVLSADLLVSIVLATDWSGSSPGTQTITNVGIHGGSLGASHSAKVAIKVNFRWPNTYRLKENANYVAGIPKTETNINRFSASIRSDLFDAYANLIDLAAVFGPFPAWRWVAASSWVGGSLRSTQLVDSVEGPAFRSDILATRRQRAV